MEFRSLQPSAFSLQPSAVEAEFDAERYLARKNAVDGRFHVLSHGAREALSLLSLMGATTAQNITNNLAKFDFPEAKKVFDDLKNDSVSFVVSKGLSEFELNPTLARIIREAIEEDEARLLAEARNLSGDDFRYKIENESGYAARYNAIVSRLRGEKFIPVR
jgi:hypothetical protein